MPQESTIVLASEQAAIAAGNLAGTVSEDKKPLENGEDKPVETEDVEAEEPETEDAENETEESKEELEAKPNQEQKPKKKGGFQKRIDKLNTRVSQAEQEREYWRQEALRAKETSKPVDTIQKPDLSTKPQKDKYATVEEYDDAMFDWKYEQRRIKERAEENKSKVLTEYQTKSLEHKARIEKLEADHDDWDDVKDNLKKAPVSVALEQLVLDAGELSAEIVYELAKNPKLLNDICKMPYGQAAKAIGKIEARLEKAADSPVKKETKTAAPKPPTPVRTKGSAAPKGYKSTMSQKEYESWRNEQLKSR